MSLHSIRWSAIVIACAAFISTSCSKNEPEEPPINNGDDSTNVTEQPSVTLTEGPVTEASVSFTIIPENAEECAYLISEKLDGAEIPDAETIFKDGELLEEVKSQLIKKDGLKAGTEYVVTAAVRNQDKEAVSEELILKTDDIPSGTTMEVTISDVSATTSTITFTITCANAGEAFYDVREKGVGDEPDAADIVYEGYSIPTQEPQTITVDNKKDNTTYVIYAVVEAADSYDRVMDTYEIITEKLPDPEETDTEEFSNGTINVYGSGRNYVIESSNDNYTIKLDFYCDDESAYMPYIASHEYTFDKNGSTDDWAISTLSSITETSTGNRLGLEKGSFTSSVENGEYNIEGTFVTTDNVEFKFKLTGKLQFNYKANYPSATASMTDDGMDIAFNLDELYSLSLLTQSQTIAGTYTVGGNILSESAFSIIPNPASFGLESGSVTMTDKGDDYYEAVADLVLEGGWPVYFKIDFLKIDTPDTPEENDVIEFTSAEAQGYADNTGYLTLYTIILENDQWDAQIEFAESFGAYDELPDGKWLYSSWTEGGDGMITQYRITDNNSNSQITDLDEGNMTIARNGDQYEINIDILRTGGESFKGQYKGTVVCEDMSGGYGY